jgi:hypothetical protein
MKWLVDQRYETKYGCLLGIMGVHYMHMIRISVEIPYIRVLSIQCKYDCNDGAVKSARLNKSREILIPEVQNS